MCFTHEFSLVFVDDVGAAAVVGTDTVAAMLFDTLQMNSMLLLMMMLMFCVRNDAQIGIMVHLRSSTVSPYTMMWMQCQKQY